MSEPPEQNGSNDYEERIKNLEEKNTKIQFEFNQQRAKLKELFIQKESEYRKCLEAKQDLQKELDDLKSQLYVTECKSESRIQIMDRKAQEEIQSLQQLVQETIEESSICKTELKKLGDEYNRLRAENLQLKEELSQKEESAGLTPVLSQVKKFVGKLGNDSKDGDESGLKSDGKYAQEDAEVLRSLVVPLEEEIKALKEKLRTADEELQNLKQPELLVASTLSDAINKSTSMEFSCSNCVILDNKIQELESSKKSDHEKIEELTESLKATKDDIKKEANLRKELEEQWQVKREEHKKVVEDLKSQVETSEQAFKTLDRLFQQTKEEISKKMSKLIGDRESLNKHLETLQSDNEYLSGKYLSTSEELELEQINLPQTVVELTELVLKQQTDLIHSRVGCEFEKRKCVEFRDEAQLLRDRLNDVNKEYKTLEKKYQHTKKILEENIVTFKAKEQVLENDKDLLERKQSELNKQISEMRVHIIELQDTNEKLEKSNKDYKQKLKNLQEDLSNSEHVQKDFVKLSQTLQMSLEKFRTADTEVRWKDDDDVANCPNCNILFTVTVRKHHCRHCGGIFCEKCLSKTVHSGPRRKLARVCDMCHTLLTPNIAPYFSKELHSPT